MVSAQYETFNVIEIRGSTGMAVLLTKTYQVRRVAYLASVSLIDRTFSGCQPAATALMLRVVLPGLAKSITPIATLWNFP